MISLWLDFGPLWYQFNCSQSPVSEAVIYDLTNFLIFITSVSGKSLRLLCLRIFTSTTRLSEQWQWQLLQAPYHMLLTLKTEISSINGATFEAAKTMVTSSGLVRLVHKKNILIYQLMRLQKFTKYFDYILDRFLLRGHLGFVRIYVTRKTGDSAYKSISKTLFIQPMHIQVFLC